MIQFQEDAFKEMIASIMKEIAADFFDKGKYFERLYINGKRDVARRYINQLEINMKDLFGYILEMDLTSSASGFRVED